MSDLYELAKAQIKTVIASAEPALAEVNGSVERTKDARNGDLAANYAMAGAKALHAAPRVLAEKVIAAAKLDGTWFENLECAGPGFLNFRFADRWYSDVLAAIGSEGKDYGRSAEKNGKKVMVEFVSANPTGPMHMGNARGGVLGDTLAAVLDACGWEVWREFYVNDAGNQIEKFAKSLEARYFQIIRGEDAVEFPEDGYHGDDIRELAQAFYELHGEKYLDTEEAERHEALAHFGLEHNLPKMKADLARYGINYDQWFYESTLHESGYVAESVAELTSRGYTYEKDGALWLDTTRILTEKLKAAGKSDKEIEKLELKDDVLRRANGFYTYFAADIAYHRNKFALRGFDRVINVWGADHHGHVARLKGSLDALGLDGENRLDIVLMQLVQLMQDGTPVKMSKRTGKAVSLTDLLDMVPADACRYFFNARPDTPIKFDLDLAVRQDSENPVYYVQYAHARICSLLKTLAEDGLHAAAAPDAALLTTEQERELIKQLAAFPSELRKSADELDPSRINRYCTETAALFHKFYNACRIRGEEQTVAEARLALCKATSTVLENALALLGVSAPDKM